MVIQDIATAGQETKDNLGARDTTKDQILLRNKESFFIEEGPTKIQTRTIGTAFILGHPTNGILGTSQLGAGTYGSLTKYAVVNPNSTFHDHLRETEFEDSTNTTANWDTTNFKAEFSPFDQLQTDSIFYNYKELSTVKLTISTSGFKVQTQIDVAKFPFGREVNLT